VAQQVPLLLNPFLKIKLFLGSPLFAVKESKDNIGSGGNRVILYKFVGQWPGLRERSIDSLGKLRTSSVR
jgi:hypothetical protein